MWDAVNERLRRPAFPGMAQDQARFGEPQLIRPRLGQGALQVLKERVAVVRLPIGASFGFREFHDE